MKQIIVPTSNNDQHNISFLSSCLPESRFFLYQRYFSKNKNRIKLVGRSITYSYDKIRKDYFISVGYGLKNFFIFNTNIIQTLRKNASNFPLKTTSLLQQRSKNLSIFEKHINFKSHQEFRYRNLSIKLKPFKNQLWLQKTSLLTKPINKAIFFSLFKCIQNLSLNSTIFVLYRSWRTNLVRIYHLGFRFLLKNAPLKKKIIKYISVAYTPSKYIRKLTYKNMLVRKKNRIYNKLQKSFSESSKAYLGIKKFRSLFLKRIRIIKIASPSKKKKENHKKKQILQKVLHQNNYIKKKNHYYNKSHKLLRKRKFKKGLNKNKSLNIHKKALKKRMLHKWIRNPRKKRMSLKNKVNIRLRYIKSKRKLASSIHNKKVDYKQIYNKYKRKVTNSSSKKKNKRRKRKATLTLKKGLKKVISIALSKLTVRNFVRNF